MCLEICGGFLVEGGILWLKVERSLEGEEFAKFTDQPVLLVGVPLPRAFLKSSCRSRKQSFSAFKSILCFRADMAV